VDCDWKDKFFLDFFEDIIKSDQAGHRWVVNQWAEAFLDWVESRLMKFKHDPTNLFF